MNGMRWDTLFNVFEFNKILDTHFYIEGILNYFRIKKTEASVKKIKDYLIKKNIAFLDDKYDLYNRYDIDFENARWVLKSNFVRDKTFVIRPSKFEIENNILILGSRFSWFSNSEIVYNSVLLFYNDAPVQQEFFTMPYSQAEYYYFIESETQYLNDILNQHEDNFAAFFSLTDKSNVKVKSFLMGDIYRDLNIIEGDRLVIRFSSHCNGKLEVMNKKAVPVSKDKQLYLQDKFDDAMYKICTSLQDNANPFTALSTLFYFENDTLFRYEQISLEELIKNSEEIECIEFGYESLVWMHNVPEPNVVVWDMQIDRDDTYDEKLFYKMYVPLSVPILNLIISKFLYDDFVNGNANENVLYETLERTFLYLDIIKSADKEKFFKIVQRRLEEITKTFNPFSDHSELVQIRNAIIDLYLRVVDFVGHLQKNNFIPSSFYNQQGVRLNQLLKKVVSITDFFSVHHSSLTEFDGLLTNAENLAEGFEMIKSSIEIQINSMKK